MSSSLSDKLSNRPRFQFDRSPSTVAFEDAQLVIDKVKSYLKRRRMVRDRRSRQAARCHVQRDVPGVVRPWSERQANFADDLCPHVQSDRGVFPLRERQSRPIIRRAVHCSLATPG